MKNVIIGTAGHIDHGKTTLIKALTGRETDNLKEEKQRGISIDLGFTFFDLPSGKRAGIIDVPGHEKFIKNMLAGITSIDVVLMVIAADEGIMPQTKEHLDILELLEVKKAIIVLTKTDLVDEEWINTINEDIIETLKETQLKDSKIIKVSSKNNEGVDVLINEIDRIVEEVEEKDKEGHFRLPVDRKFSVSGFGTVVTGTIVSGRVKIGDKIKIQPKNLEGKIRNIQIHDENVLIGEAGQRCALNISGINKDDIERGCVVCSSDNIIPSFIIDVKLKYLKSNEKKLINRQRVKVYHGTTEVIGRVILLNCEEVLPGKECFAQIRLEEEICTQKGDKLVIRNYSPMITLGGAGVLNNIANKTKRFNNEYLENLMIKENGTVEEIIENTILRISYNFPTLKDIIKHLGRNIDNLEGILFNLTEEKKIILIYIDSEKYYVHNKFFIKNSDEICKLLKVYHNNNPLKYGVGKEEIRSKIFNNTIKQRLFQEYLLLMCEKNIIKQCDNLIAMANFEIKLNKEQQRINDFILNSFKNSGVYPPRVQDIINGEKDKNSANAIFSMLLEKGELVKLPEDIIIHKDILDSCKTKVIEYLKDNKFITLNDAKELLNTSRKYLVPIMEYMDNSKITKRVDNKRTLY